MIIQRVEITPYIANAVRLAVGYSLSPGEIYDVIERWKYKPTRHIAELQNENAVLSSESLVRDFKIVLAVRAIVPAEIDKQGNDLSED